MVEALGAGIAGDGATCERLLHLSIMTAKQESNAMPIMISKTTLFIKSRFANTSKYVYLALHDVSDSPHSQYLKHHYFLPISSSMDFPRGA